MVKIDDVKNYWEKNTPQHWYSKKKPGTKEYYDEIQTVRYTKKYPHLLKLAGFNKHKGQKVLEIGCGQGTDLLQFAKNGAKVTGIDLTEGAIGRSKAMFKCYGYKADFKVANAEHLDCFEDNYFDKVFSFGVLHHTPNTQKAIDEIYRILKPGGESVVMLYAKGYSLLHKIFKHITGLRFFKYTLQESINKYTEFSGSSPLTKMYSIKDAYRMFSRFDEVNVKKVHVPSHIIPQFMSYVFGDHLFIICRKPAK